MSANLIHPKLKEEETNLVHAELKEEDIVHWMMEDIVLENENSLPTILEPKT